MKYKSRINDKSVLQYFDELMNGLAKATVDDEKQFRKNLEKINSRYSDVLKRLSE